MNKETCNQNAILANLLQEKKITNDRVSFEKEKNINILKNENKEIIEKSGITELFQTVIESKAIGNNISIKWSDDCSVVILINNENKNEVILKAGLSDSKEVGLFWLNTSRNDPKLKSISRDDCSHNDVLIKSDKNDYARDIFDYLNNKANYSKSDLKIRNDKKQELQYLKEKEEKEHLRKINYEIMEKCGFIKLFQKIIDSSLLTRSYTPTHREKVKTFFGGEKEVLVKDKPEIRKPRYQQDYSDGEYCTLDYDAATVSATENGYGFTPEYDSFKKKISIKIPNENNISLIKFKGKEIICNVDNLESMVFDLLKNDIEENNKKNQNNKDYSWQ